ncbi:MAG TPA: elongation factor Tu [Bryobacteraceae bacterium]|jgi:translation elongation factor EF-Tu-like GTPase
MVTVHLPYETYDIQAEITFLLTQAGGRQGPAFSGYRPQFFYDGEDWDAVQTYPDVPQVSPGETVRTLLSFMSPRFHLDKVLPGLMFLLREGQKTVAYGKVTKILNLEQSARRDQARHERLQNR